MRARSSRACTLALLLVAATSIPAAVPAQDARLPHFTAPSSGADIGAPSLAPVVNPLLRAVVLVQVTQHRSEELTRILEYVFPFVMDTQGGQSALDRRLIGSGVVFDPENRLILTNSHVVADADELTVRLADGRESPAEVVGADPETDIAVIRVGIQGLQAIPRADSDRLQIGDFVVAIGHPFNLGQSAALGIVSGLHRTSVGMFRYEDFIQTDATINLGDSGGALVTLDGKLVGISTLVLAGESASHIGLAIPVNTAQAIARQLVSFGDVRRGDPGIKVSDLPAGQVARQAAVIASVRAGSSAERAGLQKGDVITALDGHNLMGAADLRNRLALIRRGEKVHLLALRDGAPFIARVELAEPPLRVLIGKELSPLLDGVSFAVIESMFESDEDDIQVHSVDRASEAWLAGVRKGDLVTSVNQQRIVRAAEGFIELVKTDATRLMLGLRRQGRTTLALLQ